ncbi:glycerate kinase [Fusobacterium sp. PH5-44]|uniref:glycerate kinase n=1 Tax=unclassified Fusobacterium TaxID=2648384 RepID=UPI003D1E301D
MKNLKVVIAVDSFKGSATSKEVAASIEKGILNYSKNITVKKVSIADGGEGTIDAIVDILKGNYEFVSVTGPFGEKVESKIGIIKDNVAVLEMAESSGLNLIDVGDLNPYKTTTYGVGEVLKYVLDRGIREIYIGIGGSATNDGGAGMLSALGVKFFDEHNKEIGTTPEQLKKVKRIDISSLDKRILEAEINILSDVDNPLCGINGASYIYGPQKGASKTDIIELDDIMKNYGRIIDNITGNEYSIQPGSGAAGGLGFALLSVCKGKFAKGIEKVMELIEFDSIVKDSDLVITGEGRLDNQSVNGKAPIGIAKAAKKYNIPVVAVVGSSTIDLSEIYNHGIDLVMDIINEPMNLDRAIKEVHTLLEFTGEKVIRAFSLGNIKKQ